MFINLHTTNIDMNVNNFELLMMHLNSFYSFAFLYTLLKNSTPFVVINRDQDNFNWVFQQFS